MQLHLKEQKMKVIAFYLPQFHEIPENNEWWGKGFTEWVNVKKAKPLYRGQNQPRVPLQRNYYNLEDVSVQEWQVELAKKYGVYGFCMYHYWFNGHLLLEKPVEQYLKNNKLDLPFCLCWANENWTNVWAAGGNKILISQTYGDKNEWKKHFDYFLPFFKDKRYIKEGNCPLLVIYRPDIMDHMNEIFDFWNELAIENGFDGLVIANQYSSLEELNWNDSRIKYHIEYQPNYASRWIKGRLYNKFRNAKRKMANILGKFFKSSFFTTRIIEQHLELRDYDKYWNCILEHKPESIKNVAGAFVDWDNTPRKGSRGSSFFNSSPEKFERYFKLLVDKVKKEYRSDYIFLFAWNEWAEGGYLEPDERNKYAYLEALRTALIENGENLK